MMRLRGWMIRMRGARPFRDALGVVLLAVTALLYAVERHRAEALEGPGPVEAGVVAEPREAPDLPVTPTARPAGEATPLKEIHSRC